MSISGILSSAFSQSQLSGAGSVYQQELQQLGKDLQSSNLSAAQKDFATIQQDLQSANGTPSASHLHHHHRLASGGGEPNKQNSVLQALSHVGESLTSGNLSSAQQAYASLQQQLEQFALGGGARPARTGVSFDA